MDYKKSDVLYEDAVSKYVTENTVDTEETMVSSAPIASSDPIDTEDGNNIENSLESEKKEPAAWSRKVQVDLESLQKINEDIIGWLYFENEDISYPILYSGDNSKYLRTSYTKEYMTAGSIFLEGSNSPDFSDEHTIIYGHNMKNLSMFGKLRYYREDADYYKEHKYFQIITNDKYYRYQIFAYKQVSENADVYCISFESKEAFGEFIDEEIIKGSYLNAEDADVDVTKDNQIITLSTCTVNGMRFTVSAVLVDEEDRE